MLLYEKSHFSVKVISTKELILKALNNYKPIYTQDQIADQKEPLMVCVTGCMKQVRLGFDYHGDAVMEKFHVEPLTFSVIPCNPYIAEPLKELVHPQAAPQQFTGDGNALFDYVVVLNENHDGPIVHVEIARDGRDEANDVDMPEAQNESEVQNESEAQNEEDRKCFPSAPSNKQSLRSCVV